MKATATTESSKKDGTFRSLRVPNFRRFFVGQFLSQCGTWMEAAAVAWLVLRLTHSGVALGLVTTARLGPLLLLGPWGGLLADRVDRRRLMVLTQSALGILATGLAVLVVGGSAGVGAIYGLSIAVGLVMAVDNPTRRVLVQELVPADHLANATGLNSALITGAKTIGPALAGLVIAGPGVEWCFVLNAASYVIVVASLLSLDRWTIHGSPVVKRGKGQLREGFRYVRRSPDLFIPLTLVAVVSAFALNHAVTLPLLAARDFDGDAASFTWLLVSVSAGSVVGALVVARCRRVDLGFLVVGSGGTAVASALLAVVPTLPLAHAALALVGLTSALLISGAAAAVQQVAEAPMRGRAMALFTTVFLGAAPVGGVVVGGVSELLGARAGVAMGAVAAAAATAWAVHQVFGVDRDELAETPEDLVRQLGGPDARWFQDPDATEAIADDDTLEEEVPSSAVEGEAGNEAATGDADDDTDEGNVHPLVAVFGRGTTNGNGTAKGNGTNGSNGSHKSNGGREIAKSGASNGTNGSHAEGKPDGTNGLQATGKPSGPSGSNGIEIHRRPGDAALFTLGNSNSNSNGHGHGNPEAVLRDLRRTKAGLARSRTKALRQLESRARATPDVAHQVELPQAEMLHAMVGLHPAADHPAAEACVALRTLARQILELDDEIAHLDLQIEPLSRT